MSAGTERRYCAISARRGKKCSSLRKVQALVLHAHLCRFRSHTEDWKVHRQFERKLGRACRTIHGCVSCTRTFSPEKMQKLPKLRVEARWQKHVLQLWIRMWKDDNGAHQLSQWYLYAFLEFVLIFGQTKTRRSWTSPRIGFKCSYLSARASTVETFFLPPPVHRQQRATSG